MTDKMIKTYSNNQKLLFITIVISCIAGLAIGLLRQRGLDGSALLYIGLPTLIALTFATTSASKSVVGASLKGITFFILISGPLLQEGFICMIMAAPIFYIVGALVAWPFDYLIKKRQRQIESGRFKVVILPALLLVMSMEGVFEETTVNRHNTVEHTQVIQGSIADIKEKLASNRSISTPDSLFARLFPRPETIYATGLSVGDTQWVNISYFKWVYWNEMRGKTQFQVVENQPNFIRFKPISDDNYISSYLSWGDTRVVFKSLPNNRTQITWRINFQRKIDPAWYAEPLQRYVVGIVAKQMIASLQ